MTINGVLDLISAGEDVEAEKAEGGTVDLGDRVWGMVIRR